LSIVAAIVEAHGGTVSALSPERGGTTFEVRLPARQPDVPNAPPVPDPPEPTDAVRSRTA
jgi:hypothetical protein